MPYLQSMMQILSVLDSRWGSEWVQVERELRAALYRQILPNGSIRWNVVKITVKEAGEVFGKPYPEREVLPGPESWGTHGFTFITEKAARRKFDEMKSIWNHPKPKNTE